MGLAERAYYRDKKSRSSSQHDGSYREPPGKNNIPWAVIITVILVITGLLWTNNLLSTAPHTRPLKNLPNIGQNASPAKVPQLLPSSDTFLQEQPLPENGSCKIFYPPEHYVASFTVNAGPEEHCIVKLVDTSQNPVLYLFVHANSSATIKAPLGTYGVRWVSGKKWYGYDHLFGSSTIYRKSINPLVFCEEITSNGKTIMGQMVTLNSVINGNFPSTNIRSGEF